ncbi:MAG: gamma-glutamylcyclotransferase family protein [Granulosicoccus sp.]
MVDLFSFGTLMDAELLALVCAQDMDTITLEPAHVEGYLPLWVVDDHYPVLVPRSGSKTDGLIIRGLTPEALDRIIFFEGGEFDMQRLDVISASGKTEAVQYFADADQKQISDHVWRLDEWQRLTKPDTMPRVFRYMQCFGKMSIDEADAFW